MAALARLAGRLKNCKACIMRTASKILGLRFKMKALLTAQEWKTLSDGMAVSRSRYRHGT